VNHVYGETEVGGTSWLYLTGRPVTEVGLLSLPDAPPPQLTEAIQHGIFRYGVLPIAFYALLSGIMWRNQPKPPAGPSKAAAAGGAADAPGGADPKVTGGGR